MSKIVLAAPAMETLLSRERGSPWPREVLDDPGLMAQAGIRQELRTRLDALFECVPDPTMEISVAVDSDLVRPEMATEVYDLLSRFFLDDKFHRRLVLYLPFELIPSAKWRPMSEALSASVDRFIRVYLECWKGLLEENDVRANFVNGNILEPELSPMGQSKVRKAAHLIPHLVKKGLVSLAEVRKLLDGTVSEVLKSSIDDVMPLLAPETATILSSPFPEQNTNFSWERLHEEIAFELKKIEMRSALDQVCGRPPARIMWERHDGEEMLTSKYADRIAAMMTAGSLVWEHVLISLPQAGMDIVRRVMLRGLGKAVLEIARMDLARATDLSRVFMAGVRHIPVNEYEDVMVQWANCGIINEDNLREFGLELPKFDAAFPEDGPLASEIRRFVPAIELIAKNPRLSQFLYPIAIFYGSRLKGYAKRDADLDVAVFVKPGISPKDRPKVQRILAQLFKSEKVGGKIVEFWLEAQDQQLSVRDSPDPDVLLADSTWAHVLLAGVWLGQEDVVKKLYKKLLPGFLYSQDKIFEGHHAGRRVWLGEIELEVLQYRLMHRYHRFFRTEGGIIDIPGVEKLGPESAFWDSGYRRLAMKLFLGRVFLPQLGSRKNKKGSDLTL